MIFVGNRKQTTTGRILAGSMDVNVEGQPVARVTDIILSDCNHSAGVIQMASQTVFAGGLGVARVGDMFIGTYSGKLILGATNTKAG